MHCSVKSDLNYFYRSERTNWRELGDYDRFPTLKSYIQHIIQDKYGTSSILEATRRYMTGVFLPGLFPYEEELVYPYPRLLKQMMEDFPVYRITKTPSGLMREYHGPPPVDEVLKNVCA